MELIRIKLIPFVFILLFTLQSCAGIKNQTSSKSPVLRPVNTAHISKATSQTPAQTSSKSSVPRPENATHITQATSQTPAQAVNLAQKNIDAGEYQRAIDIYSSECRKQPRDLQLMQMYAKSLDSIKSTADKAFKKNDFAHAGRNYYVLQKNYAKFSPIAQMLSFDSVYLNTKLSKCKKTLSIQGFQEYREGRLNSAIELWQDVLDIDPNNKEIKDAVKTAKLQQKNLAKEK